MSQKSFDLFTPIHFAFEKPNESFIAEARKMSQAVCIENESQIMIENTYFKNGIPGSMPKVYMRSFLLNQIRKARARLPTDFGFLIYDGYRGIETQAGLFESFRQQLRKNHPHLSNAELDSETRKFVAHPNEPGRFAVPPHNSGGAIDIGLTFRGVPVDLGTPFDDLTEKAATDCFEREFEISSNMNESMWREIQKHRRILFNALCSVGFTNWKYEWWHFDIGNCVWAQSVNLPWIYDSLGPLVEQLHNS
jgi:D-alanyl-D-alanine dipeptidase